MNINDAVTGINSIALIGGKLLNAANTAEDIYNFINRGGTSFENGYNFRKQIALKKFKKETGNEDFELSPENSPITPVEKKFYIFAFEKGYLHKEELEELDIDVKSLGKNDAMMQKVAINLYYGTENPSVNTEEDDNFQEWKETNGFIYEKILEAKENIKKQIEETLKKEDKKKFANNIDYKNFKKNLNKEEKVENENENEDNDNSDGSDDDFLDVA